MTDRDGVPEGDGPPAELADVVRATQRDVLALLGRLDGDRDALSLAVETYRRVADDPGAGTLLTVLGHAVRVASETVRDAGAGPDRNRGVPVARRSGIDAMILRLPIDQRVAFVLTQVLRLRYAEAAEVCGVPVPEIRGRVAHARETLVDDLGASGPGRARSQPGA